MENVFLAIAVCAGAFCAASKTPEEDRQLAREIHKELIEIKSGTTTGATNPAAEALYGSIT